MSSKVRICLITNQNHTKRCIAVIDLSNADDVQQTLVTLAKNKLRLKATRFFLAAERDGEAREITNDVGQALLIAGTNKDHINVYVSAGGQDFVGVVLTDSSDLDKQPALDAEIHFIHAASFVDDVAIQQLKDTARDLKPNLLCVSGMPDLHPGNKYPVGVAFLTTNNRIYPGLVGNDIGCGMSLSQLPSASSSLQPDKVKKKLVGLEGPWSGNRDTFKNQFPAYIADSDLTLIYNQLGTIGAGNHFAEFLAVDQVLRHDLLPPLFDSSRAFLLVHSGSRTFGEKILENIKLQPEFKEGIDVTTVVGIEYLRNHDAACQWAMFNRQVIAERVLKCLDIHSHEAKLLVDIWHNRVSPKILTKDSLSGEWRSSNTTDTDLTRIFIHRKGAASSDEGLVIIPGSRGSYTYLVSPKNSDHHFKNGFSLAHGAGRSMARTMAKRKLKEKFQSKLSSNTASALHEALQETPFGSSVVCEDVDLLFEEHQSVYKDIDAVIRDLVDFGLIDVVVRFKPICTYKCRND